MDWLSMTGRTETNKLIANQYHGTKDENWTGHQSKSGQMEGPFAINIRADRRGAQKWYAGAHEPWKRNLAKLHLSWSLYVPVGPPRRPPYARELCSVGCVTRRRSLVCSWRRLDHSRPPAPPPD